MIRVRPFPLRLARPATLLPPWKAVDNRLIIKSFDMACQIPRMPFRKMPMEGGIDMDMSIGNYLVTRTQPFESIFIGQSVTFFVVALAASNDKIPCLIFQNE